MAKARRLERHAAVVARDLPELYRFVASDNPNAAESLLDAAERTFGLLQEHSELGTPYLTRNRRLQGLRMLPIIGFRDYLIFYRVDEDCVRILHVTHGARNIARLLRRDARA